MASKKRNDTVDRMQAWAACGFGVLVRALPLWGCGCLAWLLGSAAAVIDTRHRRIMMRQMQLAFGQDTPAGELRRMSMKCYRHEAFCLLELFRSPKLDKRFADRRIDFSESEKVMPLAESGRGVLVISGHIGAWEYLPHAGFHAGLPPITALARPLKNPYLNREMERLRSFSGYPIQHKENSIRAVRRMLDEGKWFCFLYDQNGGPDDAFVPFFGVPAATWRSASYLHWKCKAPIVVITIARDDWKGSHYTLRVRRILEPREGDSREEAESRALREINAALEEAIRAHPEQWMWQHRRWKTRPEGEDSRLADGVPVFATDGENSATDCATPK